MSATAVRSCAWQNSLELVKYMHLPYELGMKTVASHASLFFRLEAGQLKLMLASYFVEKQTEVTVHSLRH